MMESLARLNLHLVSNVEDGLIQSSSRFQSDHAAAARKSAFLSKSPVDHFQAFSLYFDVPLKVAAEKFGIRATAFKKRCRAIGIRHWPYRKVRSLKKSLQELTRCKEQAALSDKQEAQYITCKRQLDKLLDPQTYGLDATGRHQMYHQQQVSLPSDNEDDDDVELEEDLHTLVSPRRGNTLISDCSVSPTDRDGKRTNEILPAGSTHLRTRRNHMMQLPSPYWSFVENGLHEEMDKAYCTHHDDLVSPTTVDQAAAFVMKTSSTDDYPFNAFECADLEFLPSETNNARLLNEEFIAPANQVDITSDKFFDDVFLQISPNYGCLI